VTVETENNTVSVCNRCNTWLLNSDGHTMMRYFNANPDELNKCFVVGHDWRVVMTYKQYEALMHLSDNYNVDFNLDWFRPTFDLPEGYIAGWIGGPEHKKIYVGCSAEGEISS